MCGLERGQNVGLEKGRAAPATAVAEAADDEGEAALSRRVRAHSPEGRRPCFALGHGGTEGGGEGMEGLEGSESADLWEGRHVSAPNGRFGGCRGLTAATSQMVRLAFPLARGANSEVSLDAPVRENSGQQVNGCRL